MAAHLLVDAAYDSEVVHGRPPLLRQTTCSNVGGCRRNIYRNSGGSMFVERYCDQNVDLVRQVTSTVEVPRKNGLAHSPAGDLEAAI